MAAAGSTHQRLAELPPTFIALLGAGSLPAAAACSVLDWVSAELCYPHRHAYTAWHLLPLLYGMLSAGFSVNHLLLLQARPARRCAACAPPTP
jgi:hypothetical protein